MKTTLLTLFTFLSLIVAAQNDTVIFTPLGQYNYPLWRSVFKPLINRQGAPYLYAASKEHGFVTFDINNLNAPTPVNTLQVTAFDSLKPTYVQQENNLLFVALGDFQGADQRPGLAVLDATTPQAPVILDQWDSTAWAHGVSSVTIANGYAYVCAMEDGLLILDISNPNDIQFVSHFLPDTLYGNPPYSPTARNCAYRNDTLLLAFDAGGLRMIDVANKSNPVEIGMYVNTSLTSVANAAYNEVEWIGNYAYVPVDYCGLEVIDVSIPAAMTSMAWNNPWNCIGLSWFGSDGHANQICYAPNEQVVFVSAGDAEVRAFDASNPAQPVMIGWWGPSNDLGGSWGIDLLGNLVAVGRADNPVNSPFPADTGGVKLLQWQFVMDAPAINISKSGIVVSPNPATDYISVSLPQNYSGEVLIEIVNVLGECVNTNVVAVNGNIKISVKDWPCGIYILSVEFYDKRLVSKVVKKTE